MNTTETQSERATQSVSRQQRRASLCDLNNKLLRERELFRQELNRLRPAYNNMNALLNWIIAKVGPPTAGVNAADHIVARIEELVAREKR